MNSANYNSEFSIVARLQSELVLKLILIGVLNLWVYLPYLFLQRHNFFPVTNVPSCAFDHMIPFSDQAVWFYLSIYLLMPVGPFLMGKRNQILRYAAGIVLISLLANIVFIFWPTSCPRPVVQKTNLAYQALTTIDNSCQAFPSLHAAFAVYSALCGGLVLRELQCVSIWRICLWLWASLILYATLATKQHVLADIIAGSALGLGIYVCAFNRWISICKCKPTLQAVTNNIE